MKDVISRKHSIFLAGAVIILILITVGLAYINLNETSPQEIIVVDRERVEILLDQAPNIRNLPQNEQKEIIQAVAQAGTLEQCEYAKGLVIDDIDYYTVCRNNFFINHALSETNLALCESLVGEGVNSSYCKIETSNNLLLLNRVDVSICDQLGSETDISNCYDYSNHIKAIRSSDSNICEEISTDSGKLSCSLSTTLAAAVFENEELNCAEFPETMQAPCQSFRDLLDKSPVKSCEVGREIIPIYDYCRDAEQIISATAR